MIRADNPLWELYELLHRNEDSPEEELQAGDDVITEEDLELGGEQGTPPVGFTLKSGEEERERILRALKQAGGNKKLAARLLGIGRTTLYNKLDEHGLNDA